ncbi:hypothetical protein N9N26_01240 [Candidatus Poseidoniales archaeon]|nr:hypothetical protein [Candidatus Poseidoniales archaeon]
MNEQKCFMIQIQFWMNCFWDGKYDSFFKLEFGPFETKPEMNAEMHRLRSLFSIENDEWGTDWSFTNQKQVGKFTREEGWTTGTYESFIGWKKIRSNNRQWWDNPYPKWKRANDPQGKVIGFWKTSTILKQGDGELKPAMVKMRSYGEEEPLTADNVRKYIGVLYRGA